MRSIEAEIAKKFLELQGNWPNTLYLDNEWITLTRFLQVINLRQKGGKFAHTRGD